MFQRKIYFEAFMSCMLIFVSFMYHTLEAFKIERILLTEDEWHQVDNLISTLMFSIYLISITSLQKKIKHILIYA